jgi:hypothetical protein
LPAATLHKERLMSEPNSDFTNEPKRGESDITGQPPRPVYDYGPDSDDDRRPPIRKTSNLSPLAVGGCVMVGLALGFSAFVVFLIIVCK